MCLYRIPSSEHIIMSIRLLGIALAISALAGCASVDLQNPTSVSKSVRVERDDFKKFVQYSGPYVPLGFGDGGAYLRGFEASKAELKPLVEPAVQLVVKMVTFRWVFFDSAYDADGKALETKVLDRSVGNCGSGVCVHTEIVAITMPRGYLTSHASGLKVQISGKGGNYVVAIPAGYIQGFLTAMPAAK
jgi:hypothetical protein